MSSTRKGETQPTKQAAHITNFLDPSPPIILLNGRSSKYLSHIPRRVLRDRRIRRRRERNLESRIFPRIINRMARRRPAANTQKPLIIIIPHSVLAGILHNDLIRPRQTPNISRLIKEGGLVPLVPACAGHPFMRAVAVEGVVAFGSGAVVAAAGCIVPSVIVFAAVADWKTPFAWELEEFNYGSLVLYRMHLLGRSTLECCLGCLQSWNSLRL